MHKLNFGLGSSNMVECQDEARPGHSLEATNEEMCSKIPDMVFDSRIWVGRRYFTW